MTLAVIGCGNPSRRDDGAGSEVIARLRDRDLPRDVSLLDAGTDGLSVIYQARGASHLIVVDARAPDSDPGAILDVPGDVLAVPPPQNSRIHEFRWDDALFAGRKIYGDEFPDEVKVFLIEARTVDLGIGLTSPVSEAVDRVTDRIVNLARKQSVGDW